ncbi:MAG TPA: SIS domain-containing protein [Solirubrobacteraceae bacterium]|nr:SIS domain-containing protein [Solirubrobacteraceae bacterium]
MLQATRPLPTQRIIEEHTTALNGLLSGVDPLVLDRLVTTLRDTRDAGGTLFVAGNGGSAATASHLACDLGKATRSPGRAPVRVMSLADNGAWLSALANDEGYDRAFAGQLENFARKGDALLVISASGNSPNLVAAVECAREHGVTTLGLLGFDGGALLGLLDQPVWLPSAPGAYALVEDAHSALCHVLTKCLCEA